MHCKFLFYEQRFFSTQLWCCLTFPWIQLQMLLKCCMLHITIITLRRISYLVYLCSWLGVVLLVLYLCDPFFIFSLICIIINHTILLKQEHLFFAHFLEYLILVLDDNVNEESELFSNSKSLASECCLAFAWFFANFSLVLLIKLLHIKLLHIGKPFI